MILTSQEDHENLYRNLIVCIADKGDKIAKKTIYGMDCDIKELHLLIALADIMCKFDYDEQDDNCLTLEQVELLWDYIATKCKLCNC